MVKLAIVSSHPIQYYAPIFKLLAQQHDLMICAFYTWGGQSVSKYDPGFGREINWDIPLLDGYDFVFEKNTAKKPGSDHFMGIQNPTIIDDIKKFNADAILIFGWAYVAHLKVLRFFKGKIPIIFRGDSNLLDTSSGLKQILKSTVLKYVYSHVDYALFVGQANKAYFKKYGLKKEQLIFGPHAVDNERFSISRLKEAGDLRTQLGIPENDILILFAGKFEDKKSPLLLKEAFIQLNDPRTHLLFVGNGVLEEELKGGKVGSGKVEGGKWKVGEGIKNKEQGTKRKRDDSNARLITDGQTFSMTDRVHFMDFQNQSYMPVIYQACDLFVLPSKGPGETWGLAVNEAMACGKAVLVSDRVGCHLDLVKNGVNGYCFKHENLADLTFKLQKSVTNKANLKTFGLNSREIIKDYSFGIIVSEIKNLLAKIYK